MPVIVCAHVHVPIDLAHTQTGPSLGRLAELLTPLAYQAAEPSGGEILSEWQQWEPHLPFNTGPVRLSASVCTCVFLSDALTPNNGECAHREVPQKRLWVIVGAKSTESRRINQS